MLIRPSFKYGSNKGESMRSAVKTLFVTAVFAVFAGLVVMYTGLFNVSTTWKDPAFVHWILATTSENSIKNRAKEIEVPPLDSEEQIKKGFRAFREICAPCHTPPGDEAKPLAKGLNPKPPDLAEEAKELSAAEIFWVVKNGIRMTGMPGWGVTHTDEQLWEIVAFVKTLPEMTILDYLTLNSEVPMEENDGHGHEH